MLNDIAERDGIRRFNKLVEMTGISANTFTNIKLDRVKGVDIDTFWKLNNAFGKRYNVKWLQGIHPSACSWSHPETTSRCNACQRHC